MNFTVEDVKARFRSAAETAAIVPSLPAFRNQNIWPKLLKQAPAYKGEEQKVCRPNVSEDQIEQMLEASRWLLWIPSADIRCMIWLYSEKQPTRIIGRQFGMDGSTVSRRVQKAFGEIASHLNDGEIPPENIQK